ncbi:MAG: hypothetical protein M9958_09720 [Chitinophagales bacterium]|nr:hypothetical protein [Chitinophagales bacterium]
MMTRVFGVAITILSLGVITVNTFLYWNSSAYLDYNSSKGLESMAQAGVFYPFFVAFITLILGIFLLRDRELDSKH